MFNKEQLCDIEGRLEILEAATGMDGAASLEAALKALETSLRSELRTQADQVKRLTLGLAEGIEKVERKERRIDAVIGRARKELADSGVESPALEAENTELRLVDGTGGEEQGVPTVREELANFADAPSSVPGVTKAQLRAIRGM